MMPGAESQPEPVGLAKRSAPVWLNRLMLRKRPTAASVSADASKPRREDGTDSDMESFSPAVNRQIHCPRCRANMQPENGLGTVRL